MNIINLNDYLANLSDAKLNEIYENMVNWGCSGMNTKDEIGYISLDFVFDELDKRGLAIYSDELED